MDCLEIFNNNNTENSNNSIPTKTGLYLVYADDISLGHGDYFLAYFRNDTNKFYLHKDCYKKSDMESYWRIKPLMWTFLREMPIEEFSKE